MRYFDYFSFDTVGETLEFLKKQKHFVKVIAGGTDLIIELRKDSKKLDNIDKVLDISRLKALKNVSEDDDYVYIGACVKHNEVHNNEIIKKYFPALSQASSNVGCLQTRNQGTIGGNVVNASPSADTLPALVAYNAEVAILKHEEEEKWVRVEDFVKWPYNTVLAKDEMVSELRIKKINPDNTVHVFEKLGRRNALSITRISVTAWAELENNVIKNIKIVPGAVLPKFRNIEKAEEFLKNKNVDKDILKEASEVVTEDVFEEVGERWSTPYKKPVLKNMVYAALCKMFGIELK